MKKNKKHKIILSLCFLLASFSAFSQNKKELIQILNGKIDSLTILSNQERLRFEALNNEYKTSIKNKNEIINNLNFDLLNQKTTAENKIDSIISIYNQLKNLTNNAKIIRVNYANMVNGYKVKVSWLPNLSFISGHPYHVGGPAILQFSNTNDSLLFSVTTNNYALRKDLFSITYLDNDSLDIVSLNTSNITLQNNIMTQNDLRYPLGNGQFSFVDVDFDNEVELIVEDFGSGQRGSSNYDVYYLSDYDDVYKKSQVPFSEIDDYTEFDYNNRTITIGGSSGACSFESITYSKQGYEFIPTIYVNIDNNNASFDCIKHTYKINKNLQLIKKEKLVN